jgi:hypothetical protein
MSSVTASNKKRKEPDATGEEPLVGEKSCEELEKELLETKQKLAQVEDRAEKAEALVESLKAKTVSTEEENSTDDEESATEDANDPWTIKFKELRQHRMIHGDCKVPEKGSNPKLGQWVTIKSAPTEMSSMERRA